MHEISNIRFALYNKIKEYIPYKKAIRGEQKLYADLHIYGDSMEDIIHELSNILNFNEYKFWETFKKKGYHNPAEVDMSFLPKIFFLDIGKLLKGKIEYQTINNRGNDITVNELIQLLQESIEA